MYLRGNTSRKHMNEEAKSKLEEELMEAARLMEEVNNDPALKDVVAPADMHDNVFSVIRAKEAGYVRDELSEEEKELIQLGKVYKRKRKNRKYFLLAAVMVLAMAFGITSMGGPQKLCEKVSWMLAGRKQTNVDSESDNVVPQTDISEEEVYEQIEDKYGFYPVRINYRPEGVEFQEVAFYDEMQEVDIVYGGNNSAVIWYVVRPNYLESSIGKDIEDELLEEFQIDVEKVIVYMKKYQVEEDYVRWSAEFSYGEVNYFIWFNNMEKIEVEKVINNLYFF